MHDGQAVPHPEFDGLGAGTRVVVAWADERCRQRADQLVDVLRRRCGLASHQLSPLAVAATAPDVAIAVSRVAPTATDSLLVYWLGPVEFDRTGDAFLVTSQAYRPGLGKLSAGQPADGSVLALAELVSLVSSSPATRRCLVVDGWNTEPGTDGEPGHAVRTAAVRRLVSGPEPAVEMLVSVNGTGPSSPAAARVVDLVDQGTEDAAPLLTLGRVHDLTVGTLSREVVGWALRVPAGWADAFPVARNAGSVAGPGQHAPRDDETRPSDDHGGPVPAAVAPAPPADPVAVEPVTVVRVAAGLSSPRAGQGDGECPYPGLAAFDAAWERYFFGRTEAVADALARTAERATGTGPVVLVGASGSGKSSLLRAGVLPALGRGALADVIPPRTTQVLLTPTDRPLAELTRRIATAASAPTLAGDLYATVRTDPTSLRTVLTNLLASNPSTNRDTGAGTGTVGVAARRLVLAVDQFEEVFTLCQDEVERAAFIRAVCAAATAPPGGGSPPAAVVVVVRGDFYLRCAAYPELAQALQTGQVVLGAMNRAEVREAVVEPARAVGLGLEPGLVELVLNDLGSDDDSDARPADPGSLPLLAHALRVTWNERDGRLLTEAAYRRAGRLAGALAKTADDLYTSFDAAGQDATRQLLLRLVRIVEDGEATRRPARRETLLAEVPDQAAPAVLDALVTSRLVEADADRVQLAHEALLRSWPRLRDWIELDRAGALVRQQLDDAAQAWQRNGRDPSFLIGGLRLAAARDWAEVGDQRRNLGSPAGEFYDASVARELAAARESRRRTRRLQALVAGLTVLVVIATGVTVFAFQQRSDANRSSDRARSAQLGLVASELSATNPELGAQLALVALDLADTPEARSAVLTSNTTSRQIGEHTGAVSAVNYSPDGTRMATGGEDGVVHVWDTTDPREAQVLGSLPRQLIDGVPVTVAEVVFSADGHLLAVATTAGGHADDEGDAGEGDADEGDGTAGNQDSAGEVRIWDVTDPASPKPHSTLPGVTTGSRNPTVALSFSSRADLLAVGGYGSTARLYDVTTAGDPLLVSELDQGTGEPVVEAVFSDDGSKIATGGDDGSAALWDASAPRTPSVLGVLIYPGASNEVGPVPTVFAMDFSPSGRSLVIGRSDLALLLFDVPAGQVAPELVSALNYGGGDGADVAFLDDETVAVADTSSTVTALDVTRTSNTLFSPFTSSTLAGSVLSSVTRLGAGREDAFPLDKMEMSRDVSVLAVRPGSEPGFVTGAEDGGLRWKPWHGVVYGYGEQITSWSASHGRLAVITQYYSVGTSFRYRLMVFDVDPAGDQVARFRGWVALPYPLNPTVAFPLDGRYLAVQGVTRLGDELVQLWDMSDDALDRWHTEPPGNRERAVARPDDPVPTGTITLPYQDRYSIGTSADGQRLEASGSSGGFSVWDVSDLAAPRLTSQGQALTPDEIFLSSAPLTSDLSPDGHLLATTKNDRSLTIWDVDRPQATQLGTIEFDDHLDDLAFSPFEDEVAAVGADRMVHLVDASDPSELRRVADSSSQPWPLANVNFDDEGESVWVYGGQGLRRLDLADFHEPGSEADAGTTSYEDLPNFGGTLRIMGYVDQEKGGYALALTEMDGQYAYTLKLVNLDVVAKAKQLCAEAGDSITRDEWQFYLPGVDYAPPCR